ncbi:hypothetical protein AB0M34_12220 [Nocardia sp. NPDC050193]
MSAVIGHEHDTPAHRTDLPGTRDRTPGEQAGMVELAEQVVRARI